MNVTERMRADWNRRAKEDANFYVAFGRLQQDEEEFSSTAGIITPAILQELNRLPNAGSTQRRALDIGCGPGRLMLPLSEHFGEIHGIDISEEMIGLARTRLKNVPHAKLHVGSGEDLQPLPDGYFDLVYSYVVFQHIPSKDVVLSYMREAQRVLKPRGVFCCQLRGQAPLPSELKPEMETWTGCMFEADEIVAFAREQKFPLVGIAGIGTQYTWATFQKAPEPVHQRDPKQTVLKAVTSSSSAEAKVPARGPAAVLSLWIDALPEDGDLSNFPVLLGGKQQHGNFLSTITDSGGCQLNVRLPEGIAPGITQVQLSYRGTPIGQAHTVEVLPPPPLAPRVVDVTDGISLTSKYRAENGALKVLVDEVGEPATVTFRVADRVASGVMFESRDPITLAYEFTVPLPEKTPRGKQHLEIRLGSQTLPTVEIEVV